MSGLLNTVQKSLGGAGSSVGEFEFKKTHSLEKRKAEAQRIRAKYPDRIPCVVEKVANSPAPDIDKNKYLVPADLAGSGLVYVVRKRIKLRTDQALFLFTGNTLLTPNLTMAQIYKENKDQDGFMYIRYSLEDTFGR